MLVITLLVMGGATFLIGLLPTFEQIGIWAPILLVVLRFLQGFAVGGEWGGATLMAVEHAPEESRNFYASWPQMGAPAGFVLSTAVFTAFSSLPDEQFFAWGWRVPFLLSIILIAIGLFIRLRVLESPAFTRVKELGTQSRVPLLEVLRDYPVAALLAIGVVLVKIGGYYLVITFTLTYVTETLGVATNVPLIGLLLAGFAEIAGILIFARLSDRIGKRPVALWSAAIILLLAFPFFWLINTEAPVLIWLAMSLWTFWAGALYGITGVFSRSSSRRGCDTPGSPSATRWRACSAAPWRRSSPPLSSSGRAAPRGPSPPTWPRTPSSASSPSTWPWRGTRWGSTTSAALSPANRAETRRSSSSPGRPLLRRRARTDRG
jgi:MFS transporter, MHS family, shikimate and dehydroshikimate transport protein